MGRQYLSRKSGSASRGYRDYLASNAWKARRARWIRERTDAGYTIGCLVCGNGEVDLHHLSYEGVQRGADGGYSAQEADADLVPLCREHHQQLHERFERHPKDFRDRSREAASLRVIAHMKNREQRAKGKTV